MVEIAATITVLGLVLLMSVPNFASAASGGRMGGTSFSSSKKSSTSSSSISSYRSYSVLRRRNYVTAADSYYSARRNYFSPASSEPDDEYDANTGCFLIILFGFVCVCVIFSVYSKMIELLWPPDKTTVLKLQVGLLAPERSLQKYLNEIAETADTSTPEGFHYILRETVCALLGYHDYCISAHSSIDVKKNKKEGEKRFNQLSIEERVKFDEETLVNFNNMKKQNSTIRRFRPSGFADKHIVVTILVAAGGKHNLPCINNSEDLKKALQKLASIPSTGAQAVEVLWTPQDDGDALSEQELLEDYPLLRSLMHI